MLKKRDEQRMTREACDKIAANTERMVSMMHEMLQVLKQQQKPVAPAEKTEQKEPEITARQIINEWFGFANEVNNNGR
jgi:hypothetical protein